MSESLSVSPLDVQPSQTTQLDPLPLSIPAQLRDRGKLAVVLGSRQRSIDSETGTSSSRTALGYLLSRSRTSANQRNSMRPRRHRRDPVPESSNVPSARPDLVPVAFCSSSDDLPITTSPGSGRPLSRISNLSDADVPLAPKDVKTQAQAVKHISKSMPRPLPPRSGKGHHLNDYRISSRSRGTSSPDCFLPRDSGERVRFKDHLRFR